MQAIAIKILSKKYLIRHALENDGKRRLRRYPQLFQPQEETWLPNALLRIQQYSSTAWTRSTGSSVSCDPFSSTAAKGSAVCCHTSIGKVVRHEACS